MVLLQVPNPSHSCPVAVPLEQLAAPQDVPLGYLHAPVESQAVAPQVPVPHAAEQQLVRQIPELQALSPVQACPAPSFGTQLLPEQKFPEAQAVSDVQLPKQPVFPLQT